ncbi:hypothetical protein QF049_000126 [Paenibacillus sp. W4I10]|uniref:DUF6630 family protein n=1 Tax=Paenibacillus sp. W4I10 TaxID=3042298 RepID=UPI0027865311|nr:hypothetical protein [Paenibacillus sp. W4I10]MDQ0718865.1 hypothetical protein [Paenibacillus sp. W4I10]
MADEDLVPLIFDDAEDIDMILNDPDESLAYYSMLNHGLATKRFLFLDYKGEVDQEIVNYILDYEYAYDIELGTTDQLEELGEFVYKYLPEKIREVNKLISRKGYGLFSYPTAGDFYALFIAELKHEGALTQVDLLEDEDIPEKERHIQLYF